MNQGESWRKLIQIPDQFRNVKFGHNIKYNNTKKGWRKSLAVQKFVFNYD